jgi:signal transduction histidine kinase
MFLFHKLTPTIKGPLQWSLGSFFAVFAAILLAVHPAVPGYISFVIGGIFTVVAIAYYLAGIRVYKNLPVNYPLSYGIVLTQVFFGTLFYSILDMPNMRMISFSAICMIGSLLIVREFLKPVQKSYRLAFVLCSAVFGISAMTSLFRIGYIIVFKPGDALLPTSANQLFYFMANVTQALLLFSFLLLISLKIAERLEIKIQTQRKFFSVIAHDVSAPVCTITQMLELANNDHDLDAERKNLIYGEVEKLGESTYHLLQNLLLWARNQLDELLPNIQKFDLNPIIVENIEFLRKISATKKISINYESKSRLFCFADSRMIDTVIRNLISNAIKFTRPGGAIEISCMVIGSELQVRISDNGVGISKDLQRKLFMFNESSSKAGTLGEKGTGLGLYLCKEFVEGNKGSIQIQSEENVGTTVTIFLPKA